MHFIIIQLFEQFIDNAIDASICDLEIKEKTNKKKFAWTWI